MPTVKEGITLSSSRQGRPSILKFEVLKDEVINFTEGDRVIFKVSDTIMFSGFIFSKRRNKENFILVTAYDQLRYLKNRDSLKFENRTASSILKEIADNFSLEVGEIENTAYIIPSRVEQNSTLIDIIQKCIDLTFENKGVLYVLFDANGKICLKDISSLTTDYFIDQEQAIDFNYSSSIDDNTYNRIKLVYSDGRKGINETYIVEDNQNIGKWGVLQYFGSLDEDENGQAKAENLLSVYNEKTRELSVEKAIGDVRIRAGYSIIVKLNLGDISIFNYMLVERCVHTFNKDEHFMDLSLKGGIINGTEKSSIY